MVFKELDGVIKLFDVMSLPENTKNLLYISHVLVYWSTYITFTIYSIGIKRYRVFIKYCVFSLKFCDFSELCQFRCSAAFFPDWRVSTHTDTKGKQSPEYFKLFGKKHNI